MTALRTAAQQALEALEKYRKMMFVEAGCRFGEGDAAITALRSALAQQVEPLNLRDPAVQKRLATQWGYVPAAQAEPVEPVAWIYQNMYTEQEYLVWKKGTGGRNWRPLYTAPPQRKLVLLTEEEIMHIGMTHQSLRQVVRAVERAHGIKE